MRKNKKLMIIICVLAIMVIGSFGTLAYLTDVAGVTNTFTVGKVDITLDEAVVNEDGEPLGKDGKVVENREDAARKDGGTNGEDGNKYHLVPGQTYLKDPTVTVVKGSEESYVRTIMTIHNASEMQKIIDAHKLGDYKAFLGDWNEKIWKYIGYTEDTTANTISFEFRYHKKVSGFDANGEELEDNLVLEPLFTQLVVPGSLTGEELKALYDGGFKMVIEGHAIQVVGFEDEKNADGSLKKSAEDVAWDAFSGQEKDAAKGATIR